MILLTKPYNPGDLDPGQSYTYVAIVQVGHFPNEKMMDITWTYGTAQGGSFVPGKTRSFRLEVSSMDWNDHLDKQLSKGNGEKSWKAWDDALHQYLLDTNVVSGTLV